MATVDEYIKRISGPQKEVAIRLRELIKEAAPGAVESIKWAQPVYEENGPFAFIRAGKFHVTFGFWRGAELKDARRLLDGEGDRMRHLKLTDVEAIPEAAVTRFVKEAVKLNQERGDPTAKKRAARKSTAKNTPATSVAITNAKKATAKKAAARQATAAKTAAKRSAAKVAKT